MFSQRNFSGNINRDNTYTGLFYKASENNCIFIISHVQKKKNSTAKNLIPLI